MRTIWKGSISFGLVNIPISLYPAVKERPFEFHFLHEKDQGRIRNERVCEICGQTVDYGNLVRGYEYEKGQYVVLTDKDLDKVGPESSRHIEITDSAKQGEIDPVFFEKPYYLTPGRSGEKAYALLQEVLKQTQQIGIGRLVLARIGVECAAASGRTAQLDCFDLRRLALRLVLGYLVLGATACSDEQGH
jgi:DNA end-binding protein Ku